MTPDEKPRWNGYPVSGVGLIVRCGSADEPCVLTLRESTPKPELRKLVGVRSFPMETCERGETVFQTRDRLIREELPGLEGSFKIEPNPAGLFEVVQGVWLLVWWTESTDLSLPMANVNLDVSDWRLEPLTLLLSSPSCAVLRHGAFEPLQALAEGRRDVRETCSLHE